MDNKKAVKIVAWIAVFIWMGVIFYFSHQDAKKSANLSSDISYKVVKTVDNVVKIEKDNKTLKEIAKDLEGVIRKLSHFLEYLILGALLVFALKNNSRKGIISFFIGVLYAISDEFHQSFIDGRGPLIKDVLIDSAGLFCGILIVYLIIKKIIKENGCDIQKESSL